jgi:hypothetical protein
MSCDVATVRYQPNRCSWWQHYKPSLKAISFCIDQATEHLISFGISFIVAHLFTMIDSYFYFPIPNTGVQFEASPFQPSLHAPFNLCFWLITPSCLNPAQCQQQLVCQYPLALSKKPGDYCTYHQV